MFLPLWLSLAPFLEQRASQIILIFIIFILGLHCCDRILKSALEAQNEPIPIAELGSNSDPGWIVIDEWAGMSVALFGVYTQELSYSSAQLALHVVLAFTLFRFFDILKPWPIILFERIPGALGIMMDDIVAGAITSSIILLLRYLYFTL